MSLNERRPAIAVNLAKSRSKILFSSWARHWAQQTGRNGGLTDHPTLGLKRAEWRALNSPVRKEKSLCRRSESVGGIFCRTVSRVGSAVRGQERAHGKVGKVMLPILDSTGCLYAREVS